MTWVSPTWGVSGENQTFGMNWGKYTASHYLEWRKLGGWSISQGQCWAAYSNTPLRKYKRFVHEGGIASPFIAHWPRGIRDRGQISSQQVFHLIDIMPTLCELARTSYPESREGRPIPPSAGISMVPYLEDARESPEPRTIHWQHETCSAIRQGDWKLVTTNDRDESTWELYNLAEDRSETENLIKEHPDLAQELQRLRKVWARKTNVLPYPEERDLMTPTPWPPSPWPDK